MKPKNQEAQKPRSQKAKKPKTQAANRKKAEGGGESRRKVYNPLRMMEELDGTACTVWETRKPRKMAAGVITSITRAPHIQYLPRPPKGSQKMEPFKGVYRGYRAI